MPTRGRERERERERDCYAHTSIKSGRGDEGERKGEGERASEKDWLGGKAL